MNRPIDNNDYQNIDNLEPWSQEDLDKLYNIAWRDELERKEAIKNIVTGVLVFILIILALILL
jgi:hypothetical protein